MMITSLCEVYAALASNRKKQESPSNAKGSARQPWYIVRKWPNRPPFRIAQQ